MRNSMATKSFTKTKRRLGFEIIVKDCWGEAIAMLCETKDYVQDPTMAEALSARRGVELSVARGTKMVIIVDY
jgi:hypothetical protein